MILLQMGGPATLPEVRPFIRRMLSDRAVLAAPALVRLPLAAGIAWSRAPHVRRQYAAIGGGSPIGDLTARQAAAVERALAEAGRPLPVRFGMRYTRPSIAEALRAARDAGATRVALLPLYPQESRTTTGSALDEARRALATLGGLRAVVVRDWADDAGWIEALAATVREALDRLSPRGRTAPRVLFSAHGLPQRYVDRGDPYPARVAATVKALADRMGTDLPSWRVCYQSRVGPVRWLQPSTGQAVRDAAAAGASALVVVPVAFVSDHLETLYEIDVQYRALALAAGVPEFVRAVAVNDSPALARALAGLALRALDAP